MNYEAMTPIQKAAVALVAFGPEVSALVLKGMGEERPREASPSKSPTCATFLPEIEAKVIEECHQIFMARQYISQGGIDFASEILEKAVGSTRPARS